MDLFFLPMLIIFFLLVAALARGCARLQGRNSAQPGVKS